MSSTTATHDPRPNILLILNDDMGYSDLVGAMTGNDGIDGYLGDLSRRAATIAEVLRPAGYRTLMSGKWHVIGHLDAPHPNWPCGRGFDEDYGMLTGAGSYYAPKTLTRNNTPLGLPAGDYYLTDAISDEAVDQLQQHAGHRPGPGGHVRQLRRGVGQPQQHAVPPVH